MNKNFKLFILILVITCSEALGQYLLKLSTTNAKYRYLPFVTWVAVWCVHVLPGKNI